MEMQGVPGFSTTTEVGFRKAKRWNYWPQFRPLPDPHSFRLPLLVCHMVTGLSGGETDCEGAVKGDSKASGLFWK